MSLEWLLCRCFVLHYHPWLYWSLDYLSSILIRNVHIMILKKESFCFVHLTSKKK
jgi:hypothetical protein